MRLRTLALSIALLATVLPALAPVTTAASLVPVVKSLESHYGPEAWKDERDTMGDALAASNAPPLPAGYTGVYDNPYDGRPHQAPGVANDWGLNLTAFVEIQDGNGRPIAPVTGAYLLRARIEGPAGVGVIPAKLTKISASLFKAEFDLDGERVVPGVRSTRPLPPSGSYPIVFEVVHVPSDPVLGVRQTVASATHGVRVSSAFANLQGMDFPAARLPEFTEVSGHNLTPLYPTPVDPSRKLNVVFAFGEAHADAVIVAGAARKATVLKQGVTDAFGRIEATIDPGAILEGARSGLVIVEGHLKGSNSTVGNAVVVLPVTSHAVNITAVELVARGVNGGEVRELGTLEITATDRDAASTPAEASRRGQLLLLKAGGTEVFASAEFGPPTAGSPTVRKATVQANDVRAEEGTNPYSLVAIFTGNDNRFYGLATAERGYDVTLEPIPPLHPLEQGVLRIHIRNFATNHDAVEDSGLALGVRVEVEGLPGGKTHLQQVVVGEGRDEILEIQFVSETTQELTIRVNTTGAEFGMNREISASVVPTPGAFDLLVQRLPVPGVASALAVLALAALALRRRAP
ncbi:MAG TPA: hypothetical protein VM889_01130 [Candidatus Thermoplasmatota archaeon]|nr:hypothetical protein [Candidatus Thermoplasmatota archaeon]